MASTTGLGLFSSDDDPEVGASPKPDVAVSRIKHYKKRPSADTDCRKINITDDDKFSSDESDCSGVSKVSTRSRSSSKSKPKLNSRSNSKAEFRSKSKPEEQNRSAPHRQLHKEQDTKHRGKTSSGNSLGRKSKAAAEREQKECRASFRRSFKDIDEVEEENQKEAEDREDIKSENVHRGDVTEEADNDVIGEADDDVTGQDKDAGEVTDGSIHNDDVISSYDYVFPLVFIVAYLAFYVVMVTDLSLNLSPTMDTAAPPLQEQIQQTYKTWRGKSSEAVYERVKKSDLSDVIRSLAAAYRWNLSQEDMTTISQQISSEFDDLIIEIKGGSKREQKLNYSLLKVSLLPDAGYCCIEYSGYRVDYEVAEGKYNQHEEVVRGWEEGVSVSRGEVVEEEVVSGWEEGVGVSRDIMGPRQKDSLLLYMRKQVKDSE